MAFIVFGFLVRQVWPPLSYYIRYKEVSTSVGGPQFAHPWVRASVSQSVDLGLVSLSRHSKNFQMVFTASPHEAQRERNCVEMKSATSLVVSSGKDK